jgi:hypothetical protein
MRKSSHRLILTAIMILMTQGITVMAQQNDKILHLAKSKGKVYELLEMLAKKTGKMFIYDSDVIDNEKKAKIDKGDYTLEQAVETIIGDENLSLKNIGSHVLIGKQTDEKKPEAVNAYTGYFVLEGKIIDVGTRNPIGNVSVSIKGTTIGSVANGNGDYRLSIPDSMNHQQVVFSHIGYQTKEVAAEVLRQQKCTIELQEYVTTLQEIVIRMTNPLLLLREMQKHKKDNYPETPYHETTFYREGVENNNRFVRLSEGVFDIYKPQYFSHESEQVKLLKKRDISLKYNKDSIVAKIKAGIEACMMLDVINSTPDFMELPNDLYNYFSTGITAIDNRTANTVYFEQKLGVNEPLSCGELFVDADNYALLGAKFEINPRYVASATDMFVAKKGKGISITPQKIAYNLSYKQIGGRYYINYVRGDLDFKIKRAHRLFGSSHTHIWFEMATCNIDTTNVAKFNKSELISKTTIFDETNYTYDVDFWENMNVIPMENNISESIGKIALKVEEMLGTEK